jgi:hypothetical protein
VGEFISLSVRFILPYAVRVHDNQIFVLICG